MWIEVSKSGKELKIIDNGEEIQVYKIGIGKSEIGQKKTRDDLKTPEGEYSICVKNNKSKFHLSLGLNYPNKNDAKEALSDERITKKQYESILSALDTHGGSDWSTPIGGEIYIHGGLEDKEWSEGCVRMYNKDIESLFSEIAIGTKVLIKP